MWLEKLMNALRQIARVSAYAGGLVLLACVVMTVADVIMRNFLGTNIRGVIEYTQLSVMWAAFLSIPLGFAYGNHIAVTAFIGGLTERASRWHGAVYGLLGAFILLLYLWFSAEQLHEAMLTKELTTTVGLPMSLFWVPVIYGMALSLICALVATVCIAMGRFERKGELEL